MIRESQINNYINLIKRLHKQKLQNRSNKQKIPFRKKLIQKTLSLNPQKQTFKPKSKQMTFYIKSTTINNKKNIKTTISQVQLDYQTKNQKKKTFYGQYCSDIQKRLLWKQQPKYQSNLKKKPLQATKLIKDRRKQTIVQAIQNKYKNKNSLQQTLDENQNNIISKQKYKQDNKKQFFTNSLSLNHDDKIKKIDLFKTKIKTQSHGTTKLRKMFKIKRQRKVQNVKQNQISPRNDTRIQGWEHNENSYFDLFS